jgi:predicted HD superfamily hydrolase involved in NAD metabolism
MLPEQIAVTMLVSDALETLGVQYVIGGSFASALPGVMRATMDADLVADLREEDIAPLVQLLGEGFYADAEMMREATDQHGSFNLIHLDTMFKVDVFVARPRDFDRTQLAGRQLHLLPFLKSLLTPSRLQHSLGVMRVMAELTPIYSLDRVQAMTAGLLHDAARDLDGEHQLALAEKAGIELHDSCEQHPIYLHALVGAYLAAKELGVTDRLILDAIAAHSYAGNGQNFDTRLSRCLRFADILAPSQEWKGMRKLKGVVYARRPEEAALLQAGWLIEYFQEQRVPVHPRLARQYQVLVSKLAVAESFFDRW